MQYRHYRHILDSIDKVRQAKGHAKHPLMKEFMQDRLFARVMKYTLDSSMTFKCRSINEHPNPMDGDIFDMLDHMNESESINNEVKHRLAAIASNSDAGFELTNMILSRKPRCGVSVKTMHNLFPGTIPYFPYMRCSGIDKADNIKFPCYSQLKADGEYFDIFCMDVPKFQTRNGKIADFRYVDILDIPILNGKVCGEALMLNPDMDSFMERKDGNAIINKALYGRMSEEEANRVRFQFWDLIDFDSPDMVYHKRMEDMKEFQVPLIECRIVNNWDEAWDHYEEVRSRTLNGVNMKLEGTILKNFDGKHIDGTSPDQIKVKAEKECELEVIDTVPGTGKYTGMVGSLRCISSCEGLITDIGMGLSDEDREKEDWPGQIISVKFNSCGKSKAKTTYALTHARLIEKRVDKNHADSLEYIRKVKEAKRR